MHEGNTMAYYIPFPLFSTVRCRPQGSWRNSAQATQSSLTARRPTLSFGRALRHTYLMLIHWWMRQNVSKMNRRAFSMKSSRQATRKKSFTNTWDNDQKESNDSSWQQWAQPFAIQFLSKIKASTYGQFAIQMLVCSVVVHTILKSDCLLHE